MLRTCYAERSPVEGHRVVAIANAGSAVLRAVAPRTPVVTVGDRETAATGDRPRRCSSSRAPSRAGSAVPGPVAPVAAQRAAGWTGPRAGRPLSSPTARCASRSAGRAAERPLPIQDYVRGYRPNADAIFDASRAAAEARRRAWPRWTGGRRLRCGVGRAVPRSCSAARADHRGRPGPHPDHRAGGAQRRPEPLPARAGTGRAAAPRAGRRDRTLAAILAGQHPGPLGRGAGAPVRGGAVRHRRSRAHPHPRHPAERGRDRPGHLPPAGHRPHQLGRGLRDVTPRPRADLSRALPVLAWPTVCCGGCIFARRC